MGSEKNGQLYALEVEDQLHDSVVKLHTETADKVTLAERRLHRKEVISLAERTEILADYNYREAQLQTLSAYCIQQGLAA